MITDDHLSELLALFDEREPSTINSLALATGLDSRVLRSRLLRAHADELVIASEDYQRWQLTDRGRDSR